MLSPIIRKIENFVALSEDERQDLASVVGQVREIGADEDIVFDGDRPSHSCAILEGFACRYKLLEDGRRQIMSFEIAGDIVDLHSFVLGEMDHSIGTLTPCKIAAVFREWMVGIGRRSAYGRVAHLLCEMMVRCEAVGLGADHSYPLPITQTELRDALGLSLVHTNRTLQELRGDGLITVRAKTVSIKDWEGLKAAGEFDPRYLHLGGEAPTNGRDLSSGGTPTH